MVAGVTEAKFGRAVSCAEVSRMEQKYDEIKKATSTLLAAFLFLSQLIS